MPDCCTRLTERLGLPVLRLDDFYKDGTDPTLPRLTSGANTGLVDWDDPASWLPDDAVSAIESLATTGCADVPVYDIAHDGRHGSHVISLDHAHLFIAEGIFAAEVVASCRDLREHRKPPLVLVRRGLALMHDQRRVVDHAVARGCRAVTPDEAYAEIRAMLDT